MPSTFSPLLRLELQKPGENNQSWGGKANNVFSLTEKAISGFLDVSIPDTNVVLSTANGAEEQARYAMLRFTGTLTVDRTVTLPSGVPKWYIAFNATAGGKNVILQVAAATFTLRPTQQKLVFTDGTTIGSSDNFLIGTDGAVEIGAHLDFHNDWPDVSDFAVRLTTAGTLTDIFAVPQGGAARKIWNDGNDGSGSGLDADTVDGVHASALIQPGFIYGLTMRPSPPAVADFLEVLSGSTMASDASAMISVGPIVKQLSVAWSAGTAGGALDTGTIQTNQTYHWFAIRRPDTGVCDVLASLSPTAPTMPANYTQKRRIGSTYRLASDILPFTQIGDYFIYDSEYSVIASTPALSVQLRALAQLPTGIVVQPLMGIWVEAATSNTVFVFMGSASTAGTGGWVTIAEARAGSGDTVAKVQAVIPPIFFTNTSAQVVYGTSGTAASATSLRLSGYIDRRGQDS